MNNRQSAISYECGSVIKGLALLLMVLGHCLSFPTWYVSTPDFFHACNHIVKLCHMTGICVPVFAFITGWTYYHHQDKSFAYSLKKITTFLLDYWVILIPISLFAFSCCSYTYSLKFIGELLPVFPHSLMVFTWYVWFYILIMVLFPLLAFAEHKAQSVVTYGTVLVFLAGILFCSHYVSALKIIWNCYPYALVGYFCARFHLLEKWSGIASDSIIFGIISGGFFICSSLLLFFIVQYTSSDKTLQIFHPVAAISAPLFVTGTILLHRHIRNSHLWIPLHYIGKHSMNIWFIHCIFFSKDTREVIQPIAFFWDNPLWIFCITIIFSLMTSIIITPVQQQINRRILAPLFRKIGI